jgi:CTP:molybdopterin cytidylyltransferase MocA
MLFDEVGGLRGPGGAKQLLLRDASRVALVSLAEAAADVDTPLDDERLAGLGTAF